MAAIRLRELLEELSPPWLSEYWGSRFVGGGMGVMFDLIGRGATIALKASWLLQLDSPPDALPLIGTERSMPRYLADTDEVYRLRLHYAWDTWLFAGTKEGEGGQGLAGQLGAAGYENVTILNNFEWYFEHPRNADNWSRFVVIIEQPHDFVRWYYGDGHVYGGDVTYGSTATPAEVSEIRSIIRKWREGHAVDPWIYVILDHEYYGDPDLFYGGGAVYGADTIRWPHFAAPVYGGGGAIYGAGGLVYGTGWYV